MARLKRSRAMACVGFVVLLAQACPGERDGRGPRAADAGAPDAGCGSDVGFLDAWKGTPPEHLSGTGLYQDWAQRTLAPEARPYVPAHPLWSDGAEERRFVALPRCLRIDTGDMDHWSFPVGTRFWKE